jgi:AbrB family looped-hinge helix DNA binding protein
VYYASGANASSPKHKGYATIQDMKLRMDKSGRIVLPKRLRKRLGFESEVELEAVELPEGILLRPAKDQPSMVRVDGLWIHMGVGTNWGRVLNDAREERIQTVTASTS